MTCRLDIGVVLKHTLDFLMASFETDSMRSNCQPSSNLNGGRISEVCCHAQLSYDFEYF